jgi:hypothetical protein
MNNYSVILQFNSAATGTGKTWSGMVAAESVGEALEEATNQAVRLPRVGGQIYVTGVVVMEIKL